MAKRYHQYCPIAHALDLVGERWSLLVVRELQHGPLRYSDLLEQLGGCSTNVLAVRLKELGAGGIVQRRRLPAPAASVVYELTAAGEELGPVLSALAHWGARTLGPPDGDAALVPGWLARALRTAVAPFAPEARITFRCGDEVVSLAAGTVEPGAMEAPEAIVGCNPAGFYHLVVDGDTHDVEVDGDRDAVERLVAALPRREPAPT